jgi:hypothetical protein
MRRSSTNGPDFSAVDSREQAQRLVERGELVPLMLLSERFGGNPTAENIVFVPPFAAEMKAETDETIVMPLVADGKVTRYRAEPEYSGRSFVPIAIKIVASDPADFTCDLAIWGDALSREPAAD